MWTFGGIRIIVQEMPEQNTQTIARLQPLTGGTIHQTFGYEDEVTKLVCVVVGSGDLAALKSFSRSGDTYVLSGYGDIYGNYYLHGISSSRVNAIAQTVRPDLDCDSPIYNVEMELYLEP